MKTVRREARLRARVEQLSAQIGAGTPDVTKVADLEQSLKRAEAELVSAVLA